jgi:hypothetical protein
MGAVDMPQLAHLLDLIEPAAQAAILNSGFGIGYDREAHDGFHLL